MSGAQSQSTPSPHRRLMSKNKADMASNFPGAPDAKKPCKGILKTSSSFDKHSLANHRKSAKFDEFNVLQTYHPADKDYGHMKIEEPKTPYRIAEGDDDSIDQLDAELLADKLSKVTSRSSVDDDDDNDSTDEEETEDSKMKRLEFEKRRKLHYNEFEAVREARKLMEKEDDDDDEDKETVMEVDDQHDRPATSSAAGSSVGLSSASSDTHV